MRAGSGATLSGAAPSTATASLPIDEKRAKEKPEVNPLAALLPYISPAPSLL